MAQIFSIKMNYTVLIIIILVVIVLLSVAFLLYLNWRKQQNLHFAKTFKLILSGKALAPEFEGIYRRYQFFISPYRDPALKNKNTMTKIAVKMQNPNRKFFMMEKKGSGIGSGLFAGQPDLLGVNHFDPEVTVLTNDTLMTGVIFTEDIKRQVLSRMSELTKGLIYLNEEELVFLSPVFPNNKESFTLLAQQMDLLCDIKDTLQ